MGVFMRCLSGGLMLADYSAIAGQISAALTLLVFSLVHVVRGPPVYESNVTIVWALLLLGVAAVLCIAALWRTEIDNVAVMVIGYMFVANALGTLSWIATVPFLASSFDGSVVSSFYAGSGLGSLSGGLLGLLQHAVPEVGPRVVFNLTALFMAPGLLIWKNILSRGLGAKADVQAQDPENPTLRPGKANVEARRGRNRGMEEGGIDLGEQSGQLPSCTAMPPTGNLKFSRSEVPSNAMVDSSDVTCLASPVGGSDIGASAAMPRSEGRVTLLSAQSRRSIHFSRHVIRRSLILYAIALPMNMTTWGFSPNILPFAAAHAGCSCDPAHPDAKRAYNLSLSLSFLAMPVAAFLSLAFPAYRLRHLSLMTTLHAMAFFLELSAAVAVPFATCQPSSVLLLTFSVVAMRGIDTYVTAMLFRIAAHRFESMPELQQFATSAFGVLLTLGTFVSTLIAFILVEHGTIGCRLLRVDEMLEPPSSPEASTLAPASSECT